MTQCSEIVPCKPALAVNRGLFKMCFCIRSISLQGKEGSRASSANRPFITIAIADKSKSTEMGEYREEGTWYFGESLTMEVTPRDEVLISVLCNQQYDLMLAAVQLAARSVGQVCIPVASV